MSRNTIVPRSKLLDRVEALLKVTPLVVSGGIYTAVAILIVVITIDSGVRNIFSLMFPALVCLVFPTSLVGFRLILWALGELEEGRGDVPIVVEKSEKVPVYINNEHKYDL